MKAEGVRKLWERYKWAALILLIGAGLLLWPDGSEATDQTGQNNSQLPASVPLETLEAEMEEILGHMQGVGTVYVLLTADTDGERELARNTELRYSGSAAAPEDYSKTSEAVLTDGDTGETPTVVRTLYPTYRGALVVCQGGDRADVKLTVTEAVSALTGLPSDRVTVAKCS